MADLCSLNIPALVRKRRQELGYSQEYVASKLDISQNAYSNIELGYTSLTIERLDDLCRIMGISLVSLLHENKDGATDYSRLFYRNHLPMWFFDAKTHKFLEVNEAAVRTYGYTRDDFMTMTIFDIRPKEDFQLLNTSLRKLKGDKRFDHTFRHKFRDGKQVEAYVNCFAIDYQDRAAYLVQPEIQ